MMEPNSFSWRDEVHYLRNATYRRNYNILQKIDYYYMDYFIEYGDSLDKSYNDRDVVLVYRHQKLIPMPRELHIVWR